MKSGGSSCRSSSCRGTEEERSLKAKPQRIRQPWRRPTVRPPLRIEKSADGWQVSGPDFRLRIDALTGALREYSVHDRLLLEEGPELCVWRAPTDNDRARMAVRWKGYGLDRMAHVVRGIAVDREDSSAATFVVDAFAWGADTERGFTYRLTYRITGNGSLTVRLDATPDPSFVDLPRIGLQFRIPKEYDRCAWFGRGPHENYRDRCAGAAVGVFDCTLEEFSVPYIYPQENGNRTEVRRLRLHDGNGAGPVFSGHPHFEASAHFHTVEDLTVATHIDELVRRPYTVLHIDARQSGVGVGSCGPDTLPEYRVDASPIRLEVGIGPTWRGHG